MFRAQIFIFFVSVVILEVRSVKYQAHFERKSETKFIPVEKGYIYSKINQDPAIVATFGSGIARRSIGFHNLSPDKQSTTYQYPSIRLKNEDEIVYTSVADKYNNFGSKKLNLDEPFSVNPKKIFIKQDSNLEPVIKVSNEKYVEKTGKAPIDSYYRYPDPDTVTEQTIFHFAYPIDPGETKMDINHELEVSKAKSKYNYEVNPLQIQNQSDTMYERLKSLMHYKPQKEGVPDYGYIPMNHFHIDDDDIRTSSRSAYEDWPFFYHSPYEYEHNKMSSGVQKAKDKRFIVDMNQKYIPVHEPDNHDSPDYINRPLTTTITSTTDNPIAGSLPFFNVVLNDYFDTPPVDEDFLTLKGLDMASDDFYYDKFQNNEYDTGNRNRRLPSDFEKSYEPVQYDSVVLGDSVTQKGFIRNNESDQKENGELYNNNDEIRHNEKHNSHKRFKEFVDAFANKFGSDDHKKQSHYKMSMDQDKGEKRKGFHRVYHKDEYQEDKEFYDNSHVKAHGDEKGKSSMHKGGTDAFLKSLSNGAMIKDDNSYNRQANTQRNNYKNIKNGHSNVNGSHKDINQFRDVAKKAALNNIADYDYHYNI